MMRTPADQTDQADNRKTIETENTTYLDLGSQGRHERIESLTRGFKRETSKTETIKDKNIRFKISYFNYE